MNNRSNVRQRKGAVTIELATTLPILILLLLGTIDAGQFANAYQNVSDASRAGARMAARASTTAAEQVAANVDDYLASCFGDQSISFTVNVRDSDGNPVTDLTAIPSGSPLEVEVILPYDEVRIFPGIPQFGNQDLRAVCVMIRQ